MILEENLIVFSERNITENSKNKVYFSDKCISAFNTITRQKQVLNDKLLGKINLRAGDKVYIVPKTLKLRGSSYFVVALCQVKSLYKTSISSIYRTRKSFISNS